MKGKVPEASPGHHETQDDSCNVLNSVRFTVFHEEVNSFILGEVELTNVDNMNYKDLIGKGFD